MLGFVFVRQVCYDHCFSKGAAFMAAQFSFACFCSTDEDLEYERHGDGAVCDMDCIGDEVSVTRRCNFEEHHRVSMDYYWSMVQASLRTSTTVCPWSTYEEYGR